MKSQYRMIFVLVALLFAVSLACYGGTAPTATAIPTNPPPPTSAPLPTSAPTSDAPQGNPAIGAPQNPQGGNPPPQQSGTSSDLVTFVDQNNFLAFDLPGDWYYEHNELEDQIYSDALAYSDTFTAPDESAKMESLVIFSETSVNNSTSQAVALDLLNWLYSNTGKVGDIRISSDQIMKDGSERFEWTSRGGDYSGVTFFEVRGNDKKTWLMLTAWWSNSVDQDILDTIDEAINSYHIPEG